MESSTLQITQNHDILKVKHIFFIYGNKPQGKHNSLLLVKVKFSTNQSQRCVQRKGIRAGASAHFKW